MAALDTPTLFLGAADCAALVRRIGVAPSVAGIAAAIRADFLRWPAFDKSPRAASHSRDGVIELMPVADAIRYSFKYVNGHPGNFRFGLPTVMAFGVLADVATGMPRLVADLTLVTALRTAAMSAVAAQALARPGARTMALVGNGAQAEFQALAFQHLLGIEQVRLFDTDPAATRKLVHNLRGSGLRVTVCESTAEAVRDADIVTTATADKANATVLTPDLLAPGMHLNAIGGDCPGKTELHPGVLREASVFVEYEPQTRIEGELQQMPAAFPVTELWTVLAGRQPGRRSAAEVTLFDSVGFALEDFSALRWLHEAAVSLGIGTALDLVPRLEDPKDLFGLLASPPPALLPLPRVGDDRLDSGVLRHPAELLAGEA